MITDAGVIMTLPCSYGEGDQDRNVTRSGIHVVTEKYEDFYMSNPAAGYTNVHERFAVRISNNGEFIHANPNSSGAQGNSNVTNGCINLSTEDAQQYFNSAMYGDPVEVTRTRIELSYADGDIWDWAVAWDEWASMSALSSQQPPSQIPSTAPATPSDAPQPVSGAPAAEQLRRLCGESRKLVATRSVSSTLRRTQERRLKRDPLAPLTWSRGLTTIRSRSTCDGRLATNPITSAMSSATSGVTPW